MKPIIIHIIPQASPAMRVLPRLAALVVCLLLCGTFGASYAYAWGATQQSWQDESSRDRYTSARLLDDDYSPSFNFQSTSPVSSSMGSSPFSSAAGGNSLYTTTDDDSPFGAGAPTGRRRSSFYDDDNPIGVIPNRPPVGSPLTLLFFAVLYALGIFLHCHRLRRRNQ